MVRRRAWLPIVVICAVYLGLALPIVIRGGYRAQDFDAHLGFLELGLAGQWRLKGLTNPPGLYFYSAAIIRLVGRSWGLAVVSASFAMFNALALVLLWRCATRVLSSRSSLLVVSLIATLPMFVTASVAFASDGLVVLPFMAFCYVCLRLLEAPGIPHPFWLAAAAVTQIAGVFSKYSFVGVAPAVFVVTAMLAYRLRHRLSAAIASVVIVLVIPAAASAYVITRLEGGGGHNVRFPHATGVMTFRSLAWPYLRDLELLAAPMYFDPIQVDGQQIRVTADGVPDPSGRPGYRLLVNNRYSYPALLNLAIHTDIMNITHRRLSGVNDFTASGAPKPLNQAFQRASLVLGALLSLVMLVSIARVAIAMVRSRTLPEAPVRNFLMAVFLPGLISVGLVVAMLPFIGYEAYYAGYWLPRFVVPGFLVIAVTGAWAVSRTIHQPWLRQLLTVLLYSKLVVQIGLHL